MSGINGGSVSSDSSTGSIINFNVSIGAIIGTGVTHSGSVNNDSTYALCCGALCIECALIHISFVWQGAIKAVICVLWWVVVCC